jgi:hypothetical protein
MVAVTQASLHSYPPLERSLDVSASRDDGRGWREAWVTQIKSNRGA